MPAPRSRGDSCRRQASRAGARVAACRNCAPRRRRCDSLLLPFPVVTWTAPLAARESPRAPLFHTESLAAYAHREASSGVRLDPRSTSRTPSRRIQRNRCANGPRCGAPERGEGSPPLSARGRIPPDSLRRRRYRFGHVSKSRAISPYSRTHDTERTHPRRGTRLRPNDRARRARDPQRITRDLRERLEWDGPRAKRNALASAKCLPAMRTRPPFRRDRRRGTSPTTSARCRMVGRRDRSATGHESSLRSQSIRKAYPSTVRRGQRPGRNGRSLATRPSHRDDGSHVKMMGVCAGASFAELCGGGRGRCPATRKSKSQGCVAGADCTRDRTRLLYLERERSTACSNANVCPPSVRDGPSWRRRSPPNS